MQLVPEPRPEAGQPVATAPQPTAEQPMDVVEERLARLKRLHERGLITDEEYRAKRQEILDDL